MPPGGSGGRSIIVENNYGNPVSIKVYATGSISGFLYISEPEFALGRGESKSVSLKVSAPQNSTAGNVAGKVRIEVTRKFW